jgi:hypothetical protein
MVMMKKILKFIVTFALLLEHQVTFPSYYGSFTTHWSDKSVRNSKATRQFLLSAVQAQNNVIACLRNYKAISKECLIDIEGLSDLFALWSVDEQMHGVDIESCAQYVANLKCCLACQKLHKKSDINIACKNAMLAYLRLVANALTTVQITTVQQDLTLIQKSLQDFQECLECYDGRCLLRVVSILQDIMQQFDDVSITQYQYVILSQCAMCVLLLGYL